MNGRHSLLSSWVLLWVVDDNATNRMILRQMLSFWGLLSREVRDGESALGLMERAALEGSPYQLVILDLQMPQMNDFEVSELIKKNPVLSDVKIMILTSLGQRGDAAFCRRAGIEAYLPKPIKQSELFKALLSIFGQGEPDEDLDKAQLITRHTLKEQQPKQRLKILLAEDNPINQKFATRLLQNMGHVVLPAKNGQEVLCLFKNHSVDLVLMALQMPDMDGFKATKIIRDQERGSQAHLPIIALTAHALKGDKQRCLEADMDGYLSKPIRIPELMEAIQSVVKRIDPEEVFCKVS